MRIIRSGIIALFLLVLLSPLFAASDPYWMVLEKGKRAFREGSWGEALLLFEDAGRQRDAFFAKHETVLLEALSLGDVRLFSGSLSRAINYFKDKKLERYLEPIEILLRYVALEDLQNSSDKALESLRTLRLYPEAEYWKGEIFLREGETSIALTQFNKALAQRSYLENPAFARDILYRIADVHYMRSEYVEVIRTLKTILEEDSLFNASEYDFLGKAILSGIQKEGVDTFVSIYRYSKPEFYEAHKRLGVMYSHSGRHDEAARHLTFAFLIESSVLADALLRTELNWHYESYSKMLDSCRAVSELQTYIDSSELYQTMYYLAVSLYYQTSSWKGAARDIWRIVASRPEAVEWQQRSVRQLTSSFPETRIPLEKSPGF